MGHLASSAADRRNPIYHRVLSLIWLKCIGSAVVFPVFFVAYFTVLNHPFSEARIMPLLAPDRWLPVLPWSAWIYFSLWVYICLPSSLMLRSIELGYYLMGAVILSVFGLSIFYFLPTQVPDWGIDWSRYPTLQFLKKSDASGNACPSLHVAFAVYAGLWQLRVLHLLQAGRLWHLANALWCIMIVLSTMSTKQHVLVDVLCGGVLGVFGFGINDLIARKAKFGPLVDFRSERGNAPSA